jgi:hypothetical protein
MKCSRCSLIFDADRYGKYCPDCHKVAARCGHCDTKIYAFVGGGYIVPCRCLEGHSIDEAPPSWRERWGRWWRLGERPVVATPGSALDGLYKHEYDQLQGLQETIREPACECGAEAAGTPHAKWCPKYKPLPGDY